MRPSFGSVRRSKRHDNPFTLARFLIILAGSSLIAGAVGYGDDDVHDDRYTYPLTHWFMMGANRETIGAYNVHDDAFTRSVPTYAERPKTNDCPLCRTASYGRHFGLFEIFVS